MIELGVEEQKVQIEASLTFFVDAMGLGNFNQRTEPILEYLSSTHHPQNSPRRDLGDASARLSYDADRFAWYLLQAKLYLEGSPYYDFAQGSRVLPIFCKIGLHLPAIKTINGVENRISQLIAPRNDHPDGTLLEILVGLAFFRNNWKAITFLEERPPCRTPDMMLPILDKALFVECKRLTKSSSYSVDERARWLAMWKPLRDFLCEHRLPFYFDIDFHVELNTLDPGFVERELVPKLRFISVSAKLIETEIWTVSVQVLNLNVINALHEDSLTKFASPLFAKVVTGLYRPERGHTFCASGEHFIEKPSFIGHIDFVAGASWACDAETALEKKARHIKRHIVEAIEQIPEGEAAAVFVAWETLDGEMVEKRRLERIVQNLEKFDTKGRNLVLIHCHAFDPQVTPDKPWDFGETVTMLGSEELGLELFDEPLLIVEH